MKNLTKTTLIMSTILLMVAVPNAFADTVSEENEYDQCTKVSSFPIEYKTKTKDITTTLKVWDQGFSTIGPEPVFELSYEFPKQIRKQVASFIPCVVEWKLVEIDVSLLGYHSTNSDGTVNVITCYEDTLHKSENKKYSEEISCNSDFGWYMNSDRKMYLNVVPLYENVDTGAYSTLELEVYALTGKAD